MPDPALESVRPLLRARQVREFLPDPVPTPIIHAITEVGRWTGSSRNSQPWRFIVVTDPAVIRRLHDAGLPQTRALATAPAVVAVALPEEPPEPVSHAYDEGRAVERMLVAASMTGIAAGIAWIRSDVRAAAADALRLPPGWMVRTVLALGSPTEAARGHKTRTGGARRPREEIVFHERWPAER